MSGSLNHVIHDNGELTLSYIDCLKDAGMAIAQMYNIIVVISGGDMDKVSYACNKLGYVDPYRKNDRYDDEPMPNPMTISLNPDACDNKTPTPKNDGSKFGNPKFGC